MVTATDPSGLSDTTRTVTITVHPAPGDGKPAFAEAPISFTVDEHTASTTDRNTPVRAEAEGDDVYTYSLGGADKDYFDIDSAGSMAGQLKSKEDGLGL